MYKMCGGHLVVRRKAAGVCSGGGAAGQLRPGPDSDEEPERSAPCSDLTTTAGRSRRCPPPPPPLPLPTQLVRCGVGCPGGNQSVAVSSPESAAPQGWRSVRRQAAASMAAIAPPHARPPVRPVLPAWPVSVAFWPAASKFSAFARPPPSAVCVRRNGARMGCVRWGATRRKCSA